MLLKEGALSLLHAVWARFSCEQEAHMRMRVLTLKTIANLAAAGKAEALAILQSGKSANKQFVFIHSQGGACPPPP